MDGGIKVFGIKTLRRMAVALWALLFLYGCANPLQDTLDNLTETIPPVYSVVPVSGSQMLASTEVVLTFSETIDPDSLVLSGSFTEENYHIVWNAPDYDRLVFSPVTQWNDGTYTLVIDCRDSAGNQMATGTVTFTVDSSTPFVVSTSPDFSVSSYLNGSMEASNLTFLFSKPMKASETQVVLELDGTTVLAADVDYALSWPSSTELQLSPLGVWSEGDLEIDITGEDQVGNSLVPYTLTLEVDTTDPVITVLPGYNSVLSSTQSVQINFSEPASVSSLSLSGSLLNQSYSTTWNPGSTQATVTPSAGWAIGSLQGLSIMVSDPAGNLASPATGLMDVAVVFVASTGNDSNTGTRSAPKRSIAAAVEYAETQFNNGQVQVAQGTYDVSYQAETHILLREGISVYGGYSSTWTSRNPATYVTTIRETSTTGGGTNVFDYTNMNRAVEASSSEISTATVLDGFTIRGGGAGASGNSSALYTYAAASPTIQNCIIYAGTAGLHAAAALEGFNGLFRNNTIYGSDSDGWCWTLQLVGPNTGTCEVSGNTIYGGVSTGVFGIRHIVVLSAAALVKNNTIHGGDYAADILADDCGIYISKTSAATIVDGNRIYGPTGTARVVGMTIYEGSPLIRNNLIYLPEAGAESTGPYVKGFDLANSQTTSAGATGPTILNNTCILGTVPDNAYTTGAAWGVYAYGSDDGTFPARIENNIFYFTTGTTDRTGIWFWHCPTEPTSVKNNCFFNNLIHYQDDDNNYAWVNNSFSKYGLATMESAKTWASGNVYINPNFVNLFTDFHLRTTTDVAVRQGGLTLAEVTKDLDGITRTAPYSMGAYERN